MRARGAGAEGRGLRWLDIRAADPLHGTHLVSMLHVAALLVNEVRTDLVSSGAEPHPDRGSSSRPTGPGVPRRRNIAVRGDITVHWRLTQSRAVWTPADGAALLGMDATVTLVARMNVYAP